MHLASRFALVSWLDILILFIRFSQIYLRVKVRTKMVGNTMSSGMSVSSSLRISWMEISGISVFTTSTILLPTLLLNEHVIRACVRSSGALVHRGHIFETAGLRSWSRLFVTNSLWRSLKLKLVRSLPRPLRRLRFQQRDKLEFGNCDSTLQGLNFLGSLLSIFC